MLLIHAIPDDEALKLPPKIFFLQLQKQYTNEPSNPNHFETLILHIEI